MGGSSSSSSSSTKNFNRDARVAGDNGALGVSAEGDVHIVPDEAFALGGEANRAGRVATRAARGAVREPQRGGKPFGKHHKDWHSSGSDRLCRVANLEPIK